MFTALVLIILTILVGIDVLSSFPRSIIIVGTIAILLMNVFQPVIEWIYPKFNNKKEVDVKGNSFIISLVFSIIIGIFSYILFHNIEWFEKVMKNGFVWGINTAILLINIAILEINNNNLKAKEEYNKRVEELLERYKDKETIKRLMYEKKLHKYRGEQNERKNKNKY
ncbi:hypothetical protein [Staphylococcus hominis]|uniref:hypothetical protein n=1 Tax=Staphylococcus hominis TaxID=1290 RepID=UPI0026DF0AB3|nr:hypothetical protein [Staphylococcus hominis]